MTLRVALADDSGLLVAGIARLLSDAGLNVVGVANDGPSLLGLLDGSPADVAVIDICMPPTFTTEGIGTALEIRARFPNTGTLLLSQHVETDHAVTLLNSANGGVGYLLKDRVADVEEFIDALHRVAAGGTAVDPELVRLLLERPHRRRQPLDSLTEREKDVLRLMAEGRSNRSIGTNLFLGERTVEAHIRSIFLKLDLPPELDDHRRVLAVLIHVRNQQRRFP